ncbi:MAG: zinc ABC transporter substrate-binding protein [Ruminococcus sp.]|nr:zinc ABC transporter substrate-binding protein [Candidatus Apopatosoma intestinale]
MKRIFSLILICVFFALSLCGCAAPKREDGIQIVVTLFPPYDWVREIVGDVEGVTVTLLEENGVDVHSYQPTVDDMVRISSCDLFIGVGGESDRWITDALKGGNPDRTEMLLLPLLGDNAKEEELVEGMEGEEDEEEDETEYDEHVWLSLQNAVFYCRKMADALCEIDGEHAPDYRANAEAYIAKLMLLDQQYRETTDHAARKTVLFGDRFPFRYLVDDYGLTYYAAFVGCSSESAASFETVIFLANKVDELSLPCVLALEGTNHLLAQTIIDTAHSDGVSLLVMDSMQSVTSEARKAGKTYLSVMEDNLAVLSTALK